ncbi:High-affinity zinc uptake system protein ZnuA precursor [Roseovarius litorisediminis]|uniref:High-affinity zinc uptake system protein ZnuA n=1 Tax=Roseovarius litorisediminis TaxID=1312363 RepID=A0A1Y5SHK1_9RHOB|nr:zinc ABC transporter substrate-binding protein [Roseovarius litorisediminis]SLN40287.1 High-affinity zinc uptake system protein ZnuA precursor [Roseovarius litorisediminis]
MRLAVLLSVFLGASAAVAEVPRVVTDIAPIHSLAAQVMAGVGEPDLIIQPGVSPHSYAMRPSEASALAKADLVIWMGEGLTPWLAGAIDTLAPDARKIALLESDKTQQMPRREGVEFGHEAHDEHDAHNHADGVDPHAWLSPGNAREWLFLIAAELSAMDPEHAGIYQANAESGAERLEQVVQSISKELEPVRGVPFVVLHDAYQYFENSFDIPAAAAISLSDATSPGPARLADLRALVKDKAINCVLSEPQFDTKLTGAILAAGYKTGELDPMGARLVRGAGLYPAMLQALAKGFASCAR